ncbi:MULTISPECIES: hypothetical protein [Bacillus cereus group]|uniref:hypothetical protein n=1 Tax=Bacillus cereus group TaxID=86661 RepID=UPI0018F2861D|nr:MULTISPECIES: hypothetical protein [Bacillus cereus group]MBJ8070555.1 hypothetical protein [Bacillus cereus]MBJ8093483.1 hypothetical protein [Bacillus cereus]CAH2462779.1 hypothetical protein ACOSJ1_EBGNOMHC_00123 [Bacillus mycoides KBAB4]
MSKNLREILLHYRNQQLLGDKVHVIARKNGEVVFNGYYKINCTIETNYSRLTIDWPKDYVVPAEYRDYYGMSSMYPVDIEYFEKDDIVHLSGKYLEDSYKVVVQLPEKHK